MFWLMLIFYAFCASMLFCFIYSSLTIGKCKSKRKLYGKTVLVTGSNRGIGYMTALDLAKRGARVIITSENIKDLERARKQMIVESGNKNIVAKYLDLLSLDGVRAFAKDIIASENRLDVLVNNAGTLYHKDKYTKDGLLAIMQINYFGPFLLTCLLINLLKKSGPSRIVNTASGIANLSGCFDPLDINRVKGPNFQNYFTFAAYTNSKICIVHATIELAKILENTGVTVNCLHPGAVHSHFHDISDMKWLYWCAEIAKPIMFKTTEQGAETTIHVAICEEVDGVTGRYFSDCRPSRLWIDLSAETRARVWEQSIKSVGLKSSDLDLNNGRC